MLSQWLWIIVCHSELVTLNHGVLCTARQHSSQWFTTTCTAKLTMIHNHFLSIIHHDSQPLTHHNSQWITSNGLAKHNMIHNQWLSMRNSDSQQRAEMVVNHCEFCCASGCEPLWAMLSQWRWIMVCYAEPVVLKHCELCWAQCVRIMVCYAEPVGVNHGELCSTSGCYSCCGMLLKWVWIMVQISSWVTTTCSA
jgi:hypothetical protein